ncbi:hypothetical protein [Pseudomonas plecoglossicida]|uniref:hypothetical protein n=1 Tax=Pseudomonas plecoglossicida TaxID=70775 RepID=UPI00051CF7AE|nr:hypothetical protein [Pseudomonas plecoglossicida]KGK24277.1 hypothetical protein GT93_05220 [Pseudomonas plecoglossicida]
MTTPLEQARADVLAARKAVDDLEHTQAFVEQNLPKARQQLEAAVAAERRITRADGRADQLCRQSEVDRLTQAIHNARHGGAHHAHN